MTGARTYLDYNASAPLCAEARAAVIAALAADGNPSSVHAEGRRARAIVEGAREEVAALAGARPADVVFTSGATEANAAVTVAGWDVVAMAGIEHDSVLAPARASGARLVDIAAAREGNVTLDAASAALAIIAPGARGLIALQLANNETGVIQPVGELAVLARERGLHLHTDAVQAAGRIALDFGSLGVDTMSLSAHKLGGPKGVGALVIRDGVALRPLIPGGGQERRRRGGTENLAGIAGFGAAARAAVRDLADMARVRALRERLEEGVRRATPAATVVGAGATRLANTSCIALPGKVAGTTVIKLDLAGIAVSAGAACSSGAVGPSHVLAAMGVSADVARAAIRVSIGIGTTEADITAFLEAWKAIGGDVQIAA